MDQQRSDTPFFNWSRRKNLRVEVRSTLTLESPAGKIECTLHDLSLGGMYLLCKNKLPVGSHCGTTLRVKDGDTIHNLNLHGEVVHHYNGGMGIHFLSLSEEATEVIQMIVDMVLSQATIER